MNEIKKEYLKIAMVDLIRNPKIQDEKYKSAYIDGVLDLFNKIKDEVYFLKNSDLDTGEIKCPQIKSGKQ